MKLPIADGRQGRVKELDGWRAVSVSLVILAHLGAHQHEGFLSHYPRLASIGLATVIASFGNLGVKCFFVISGFVICRLLISEESRYGAISLKAFYFRRACRILPPFYLYLGVLSVLLSLGFIHEHGNEILRAALFLSDLQIWSRGWFEGHSWSLSVEEQFYILFPTMWVLTPKRWKGQVFVGIFFLCSVWNLSANYMNWDALSHSVRGGFACIAFGVLMAIHEARLRTVVKRFPFVLVTLIALALLLYPLDGTSWQQLTCESLLAPPAIGLVLLFSLESKSWLRTFLLSKPMQAIGLTSYGIYLWQELFTANQSDLAGRGELLTVLLPLLFVIVPLSYFLLETPAMRLGKFLSSRARGGAIPPARLIEEPISTL